MLRSDPIILMMALFHGWW